MNFKFQNAPNHNFVALYTTTHNKKSKCKNIIIIRKILGIYTNMHLEKRKQKVDKILTLQ